LTGETKKARPAWCLKDKGSGTIWLVHYTTQEYFQRTRKEWFPHAKTNVTTIGVTYLSFETIESGFCETDAEYEKRLLLNHSSSTPYKTRAARPSYSCWLRGAPISTQRIDTGVRRHCRLLPRTGTSSSCRYLGHILVTHSLYSANSTGLSEPPGRARRA
jgi:hypothetical protein